MIEVKSWATSDSPRFYIYAEQIANLIFPKVGIVNLRDVVSRYLIVIHPDNNADFYSDDFQMVANVRPNRDIQAGEVVYAKDISDIAEVTFPDIKIEPNDQVIFLQRSGWRFGIFFNLSREIDVPNLGKDIARLQKELVLEDVLQKTLANLKSAEADAVTKTGGSPEQVYEAYVITEGKTDWRHLEAAFAHLGYERRLEYSKSDQDLGDSGLMEICRRAAYLPPHRVPVICVFDRDNPRVQTQLLEKTGGTDTGFQAWGNNVFSMLLPKPPSRENYENISIEMYYPDEVIRRQLGDGKRLFFDNELKKEVMPGGSYKLVPIEPVEGLESTKKIYSTDVDHIENESGEKVGISKTVFADLVSKGEAPFSGLDFKEFEAVRGRIEQILTQ